MANNADEVLLEFTERVRSFGANAQREIAAEAAPGVKAALRATAAAGTDPYGKAWPAKKDGGRPLVHAADAIEVTAKGEAIECKVTGLHAIHNSGAGKTLPKRQILPDGPMPPGITKALQDAASRVFARRMGAA